MGFPISLFYLSGILTLRYFIHVIAKNEAIANYAGRIC